MPSNPFQSNPIQSNEELVSMLSQLWKPHFMPNHKTQVSIFAMYSVDSARFWNFVELLVLFFCRLCMQVRSTNLFLYKEHQWTNGPKIALLMPLKRSSLMTFFEFSVKLTGVWNLYIQLRALGYD